MKKNNLYAFMYLFKEFFEPATWFKGTCHKSTNLNSIPRTHRVERKKEFVDVILQSQQVCRHAHTQAHK